MRRRGRSSALPGFAPTLAFTAVTLALVVVLPLIALGVKGTSHGPRAFLATVMSARVVAACRLSLALALAAALVNGVFGLLVAWALVRGRFPGRRLADACVDLPFALPTAVAGIALTSLYAPTGWLGRPLAALGWTVAYTRLGIGVALVFVGLPFVVRTLQPVLLSLDPAVEEAAASLGATGRQTFFRVLLPALLPAWLTGFALAFARGIGEYGSVVFIAGNMPMKTEIAPLLILTKLEEFDEAGAAAIATVLLLASFLLLVSIEALERAAAAREGAA